MLKKTILSVLLYCLYCGSLGAMPQNDLQMESMLHQGKLILENAPVLKPEFKNKEDKYAFTFCLLENKGWGIAPLGKSTAYRVNPESHQIESSAGCQRTLSAEEFERLSQYVLETEAHKAQWKIKGNRLCYNKKDNNSITSICQPDPSHRDNLMYPDYMTNAGVPPFPRTIDMIMLATTGIIAVFTPGVLLGWFARGRYTKSLANRPYGYPKKN